MFTSYINEIRVYFILGKRTVAKRGLPTGEVDQLSVDSNMRPSCSKTTTSFTRPPFAQKMEETIQGLIWT